MTDLPRSRTWTALLVCGTLTMTGACATPQAQPPPPQQSQLARAVSTPSRMDPPEYLPPAARQILKTRMASHVRQMSDLVSAIMVLDYPNIADGAERIASDASLSRPITGDATELNSALPEKFFVHQDDLRKQARALNADRVADAYGHLSEACVRCHAVYRQGS